MLTNFFAVTLIIFFYKEFQHMSFASDNCVFCHQTKTSIKMLFEHFDSLYPKGMCEISKRITLMFI